MEDLKYKIAIINPFRPDGLARTVFDGIISLNKKGANIDIRLSSKFDYDLPINESLVERNEFIEFAKSADLIFVLWGKDSTDFKLAEEIDLWSKTIFIDGSEVGKNRRFDELIQKQIILGVYEAQGKVDSEMLKKAALYFRREQPYVSGIVSLPFGIESKYTKYYSKDVKKDLDFICIFGQDEYPLLRREVSSALENFCIKNNFTYSVKKTKSSDEFYKLLARSKVGVSVGGGGFDTFRFWEILGNNCLLLTEKIGIYEDNSERLKYKNIFEFTDLESFNKELAKIGEFLRSSYKQEDFEEEYQKIINEHSSEARFLEIIEKAREKGIIG